MYILVLCWAVPWIRQLVARLSWRNPGSVQGQPVWDL